MPDSDRAASRIPRRAGSVPPIGRSGESFRCLTFDSRYRFAEVGNSARVVRSDPHLAPGLMDCDEAARFLSAKCAGGPVWCCGQGPRDGEESLQILRRVEKFGRIPSRNKQELGSRDRLGSEETEKRLEIFLPVGNMLDSGSLLSPALQRPKRHCTRARRQQRAQRDRGVGRSNLIDDLDLLFRRVQPVRLRGDLDGKSGQVAANAERARCTVQHRASGFPPICACGDAGRLPRP